MAGWAVQKDNDDSFGSLLYHLDDNNAFPERAAVAGPGYWNDMDMLMVGYLLRPLYMEYLYVEFVCKCIYVYFTYILDGAGTSS